MDLLNWLRIDAESYVRHCWQAHLEDCRQRVEDDARALVRNSAHLEEPLST